MSMKDDFESAFSDAKTTIDASTHTSLNAKEVESLRDFARVFFLSGWTAGTGAVAQAALDTASEAFDAQAGGFKQ